MHARRGIERARVRLGQGQGMRASVARCARHHQLDDTMVLCTIKHRIKVVPKGFVGEIRADIDELHAEAKVWEQAIFPEFPRCENDPGRRRA
jgi:hypothetical protein